MLDTRPLGDSDLEITTVGLGTWAMGGGHWAFGWGPQRDADSLAAMERAVGHGINWFDTAAVYGLGHAEELIGRFLQQLPASDRPLVFTKCGLEWDPVVPAKPPARNLRPAWIRTECEGSLRRLGVECLDLYQFHWPDTETGTAVEDSWAEMERLAAEGKIRHAGVSNFDIELLARCEAMHHVACFQPPFSMIQRDAAERDIPWCVAQRTGVIAYSPMESGVLTDGFSLARLAGLPDADFRKRSPRFQSPRIERHLALRDALRPVAARHQASIAAVSVAWTVQWPGVTGAIVGARSSDQVEGWIAAAALRLDHDDLAEIRSAIEMTGAGSGPTVPP